MDSIFNKVCRCCLLEVTPLLPIFNKKGRSEIIEMLTLVGGFKVIDDVRLPDKICLSCLGELNKSHSFHQKIKSTNSTLETYLAQMDEDEENIEEEETTLLSVTTEDDNRNEPKKSSKEEPKTIAKPADINTESTTELNVDDIDSLLNRSTVVSQKNSSTEDIFIIIEHTEAEGTAGENSQIVVNPNESTEDLKSNQKHYKCYNCQLEFVRKKNYENHFNRCKVSINAEEPELKKLCTRTKSSESTDLKSNPNAKTCKFCGAFFLNEKSLKFHENSKKCMNSIYVCDHCQFTCEDSSKMESHIKEFHLKKSEEEKWVDLKCSECNVEFKTKELLDNHCQKSHGNDKKKHACNYCNRSFGMLSTLKDHIRTHTGEKPFLCSYCGKKFSQATNLKQHVRRHSKTKPFSCNICGSSYVSKGEVTSHMRTHTLDHPFECDLCNSKFTTSSSLRKHKRIHTGEKRYGCSFCPLRFTALGTLKNHERTHTGEKPFSCEFCDRSFAQKSDLVAHKRTHTGERPYKCNVCGSSFHQSGTLKTHMKTHNRDSS